MLWTCRSQLFALPWHLLNFKWLALRNKRKISARNLCFGHTVSNNAHTLPWHSLNFKLKNKRKISSHFCKKTMYLEPLNPFRQAIQMLLISQIPNNSNVGLRYPVSFFIHLLLPILQCCSNTIYCFYCVSSLYHPGSGCSWAQSWVWQSLLGLCRANNDLQPVIVAVEASPYFWSHWVFKRNHWKTPEDPWLLSAIKCMSIFFLVFESHNFLFIVQSNLERALTIYTSFCQCMIAVVKLEWKDVPFNSWPNQSWH